MKKINVKKMTVVAMLTALGYLCMLVFRFKVGFLTFDIKDAVLAIASLLYGPLTGVFASAAVALLELVTVSDTGIYGLIMNFLSSATFTSVVGLIYKYRHSMSGAVVGAVAAITGGKGGGRPDSAMSGGRDLDKVDEALARVEEILSAL